MSAKDVGEAGGVAVDDAAAHEEVLVYARDAYRKREKQAAMALDLTRQEARRKAHFLAEKMDDIAAERAALVELEATNTYAEITKLSDVYYRETMRQSGAHLLSTATTCDGCLLYTSDAADE